MCLEKSFIRRLAARAPKSLNGNRNKNGRISTKNQTSRPKPRMRLPNAEMTGVRRLQRRVIVAVQAGERGAGTVACRCSGLAARPAEFPAGRAARRKTARFPGRPAPPAGRSDRRPAGPRRDRGTADHPAAARTPRPASAISTDSLRSQRKKGVRNHFPKRHIAHRVSRQVPHLCHGAAHWLPQPVYRSCRNARHASAVRLLGYGSGFTGAGAVQTTLNWPSG